MFGIVDLIWGQGAGADRKGWEGMILFYCDCFWFECAWWSGGGDCLVALLGNLIETVWGDENVVFGDDCLVLVVLCCFCDVGFCRGYKGHGDMCWICFRLT